MDEVTELKNRLLFLEQKLDDFIKTVHQNYTDLDKFVSLCETVQTLANVTNENLDGIDALKEGSIFISDYKDFDDELNFEEDEEEEDY